MAEEAKFIIKRVYIKDCSFESPMTPQVFSGDWKPQTSIDMNISNNKINDELYEVILNMTLKVSVEDEAAFLIEVQQAGLFEVIGLSEEQMVQAIAIMAPTNLFPYLREAIDSLVVKGGFPPVTLKPINFEALYAQRMAKAKAEAETESH